MRKTKLIAYITIFMVLFLFIIISPKQGDPFSIYLQIATISAAVGFFGVNIYYRYLWKLNFFANMHGIINIGGKWVGKDKNGDETEEKNIKMKIVQHFDEVKIKLVSDNSIIESLISSFKRESTGQYLYFLFRSRPKDKIEAKEDIFFGTMIIKCDHQILIGEYFTSKGEIKKIELYKE